MTLDEYRNSEDRNLFWRLSEGARQNLLDEAVDCLDEMEALAEQQQSRVKEAREAWCKAHPGREHVYPDLGKLIEWLMYEAGVLNWNTIVDRGYSIGGVSSDRLLWDLLRRIELADGPRRVSFPEGVKEAVIGIGRDNMATIYLTDDDKAALDAICRNENGGSTPLPATKTKTAECEV